MTNLTFNNGTVEQFTLVLSQRDQTHLGQIINIKKETLNVTQNLNDADELSFEVCKVLDGVEERLWDDIYDLRLVWVKELNEYFEIQVESTDQVYITKTITGRSLCESELSQVNLNNIEINTAEDIARPDYDANYPTVFYRDLSAAGSADEREKWRKSSLLHRILEKVPAYTIGHVDETLMNLQRIFSISKTSVLDFLNGDCAEQFNCLFQFDSVTRTISAYDLYSTCLSLICPYYVNTDNHYYSGTVHKHYRNRFNDVCPICGSSNITYYGQDTEVFVSTENLTDEIKFDTDVDSMKNCFRLEAGDDNMTAAVINSNPNGTQYIYEFNEDSLKDMPSELVSLIDSYNVLYDTYNSTTRMDVANPTLSPSIIINGTTYTRVVNAYNALCRKYNTDSTYHKGSDIWKQIPLSGNTTDIHGYHNLMPFFYNSIDFASYLKSTMMPYVAPDNRTIQQMATDLYNAMRNEQIAFATAPSSQQIVENAVLNIAKLYANTGVVKLKVNTTTTWTSGQPWKGTIILTSYEDDSISQPTSSMSLTLVTASTDYGKFMQQKIDKQIKRSKEIADLYDVLNIGWGSDGTQFKNELKKYGASRLQSFHDALEGVLGILVEAGQGYKTSNTDKAPLYDTFYTPYYNKLKAVESELNVRNREIEIVYGLQDAYGKTQVKGVNQYIIDAINKVQKALNFKQYIYDHTSPHSYDLYNVYTTYIREDTYSNSNYISDDLNNDQLFENAGKFLELAKDELHKSAVYQHSISTDINNLIAIKEFEPLLNKFQLGNWIRVKQDEKIYRLRLISYSINFGDLQTLNTKFSDVTETADGFSDIQSILRQASSMASSYGYVEQQAADGAEVKTNYIDDWVANGLNSALIRINNNDDEDITIDNGGIHARTYDDILDDYDQEQLRITHNVIAFTKNNWQTVETALGKFEMQHHSIVEDNYGGLNKNASAVDRYTTYGLVADAVLAGWIVGSHMETSTIIGSHFQAPGNASYFDMTDASVTTSGREYFIKCNIGGTDKFTVKKDGSIDVTGTTDNTLKLDTNGNLSITGKITASSGAIGAWTLAPTTGTQTYGQGALWYLMKATTTVPNPVMGLNDSALLSPKGYTTTSSGASSSSPYKRFGWSTITNNQSKTWAFGVNNNFGVTTSGILYASGAVISGSGSFSGAITATSGAIGHTTSKIQISTSGDYPAIYYEKSSIDHNSNGFYVGSNGISCGPVVSAASGGYGVSAFKVTNTGTLYASGAYISGNITSSQGTIGGWTLDSDCIYRTNKTHAASDGMYFGVNGISIKNIFYVDKNGKLTCSNVSITGSGNDNNAINLGSGVFTVTNKGKLTCSNVVITGSGNNNNAINLGSGVFTVTNAGALTCSNATINGGSISIKNGTKENFKVTSTGSLTAKTGSIGPWTLNENAIYTGDYKIAGTMYFGTSGLSISNKFFVDSSGSLTCTGDATIKGKIESTKTSTFCGWTIGDYAIYRGSEAFNNASTFYFGASGLSIKNKFSVNSDGKLSCSEANISGDITSTNVSITNKCSIGNANIINDAGYLEISMARISGNLAANRIEANSLDAISANLGSMTSGSIESASIKTYYGSDPNNTTSYTRIDNGSVAIATDSRNYFQINYKSSSSTTNDARITIGQAISVRDDYNGGVYGSFTYRNFWKALYDAQQAEGGSDRRLKKKIKNIPKSESRDFIQKIQPRYYEFRAEYKNGKRSGFIAQEIREVLDNLGNDMSIELQTSFSEYRELRYQDFIAHLVNTTQDLYKEIDKLKKEINRLKGEIKHG